MEIKKYAFWNNKGGTGKTSLAFQAICQYAENDKSKKILAIDVCPQGNLSELLLGGMQQEGSKNLYDLQKNRIRQTIGGYFGVRLNSPYSRIENFKSDSYLCNPHQKNSYIPKNIDLLAGDPILELQSNAMSSLANQQIPGISTWLKIVDWLTDFIEPIQDKYDAIFFDLNPSFSMYTQIALATSNMVILPIMADDSSRRAILNAFSLMYSLSLPSDIYRAHAFGSRLNENKRDLPKVHLIVKNRITQYMGEASGYARVLSATMDEVRKLYEDDQNKKYFTKGFEKKHFSKEDSMEDPISIGDFNTAGVVAFAKGMPFFKLEQKSIKSYTIGAHRVSVKLEQRNDRVKHIEQFVKLL